MISISAAKVLPQHLEQVNPVGTACQSQLNKGLVVNYKGTNMYLLLPSVLSVLRGSASGTRITWDPPFLTAVPALVDACVWYEINTPSRESVLFGGHNMTGYQPLSLCLALEMLAGSILGFPSGPLARYNSTAIFEVESN